MHALPALRALGRYLGLLAMESVGFTAKGELRVGGGLQGTVPLDGKTNVTAAVPYQIVLFGWQP